MNKTEKQMYAICIAMVLTVSFIIASLNPLGATITGFEVIEEETQNIATREDALNSLLRSESDLRELKDLNLSVLFVQDKLLEAKRFFIGNNLTVLISEIENEKDQELQSYLKDLLNIGRQTPVQEIKKLNNVDVVKLDNTIGYRKEQAYRIIDTISLLEEKEKKYNKNGVNTSVAIESLEKAKKSFAEERYNEAESNLEDTDKLLEEANSERERISGLVNLSKNFIERNWWGMIFTIFIVVILFHPIVKKVRNYRNKEKTEDLKMELKTITNLIKKAQTDFLVNKKITRDTYQTRMDRYKTRMLEIKEKLPVFEAMSKERKRGTLNVKK